MAQIIQTLLNSEPNFILPTKEISVSFKEIGEHWLCDYYIVHTYLLSEHRIIRTIIELLITDTTMRSVLLTPSVFSSFDLRSRRGLMRPFKAVVTQCCKTVSLRHFLNKSPTGYMVDSNKFCSFRLITLRVLIIYCICVLSRYRKIVF